MKQKIIIKIFFIILLLVVLLYLFNKVYEGATSRTVKAKVNVAESTKKAVAKAAPAKAAPVKAAPVKTAAPAKKKK